MGPVEVPPGVEPVPGCGLIGGTTTGSGFGVVASGMLGEVTPVSVPIGVSGVVCVGFFGTVSQAVKAMMAASAPALRILFMS